MGFSNYNFNNSYYLDVINDILTNERKITYSKLDFQNNVNNLLFLESSYYISLKNKLFLKKIKLVYLILLKSRQILISILIMILLYLLALIMKVA